MSKGKISVLVTATTAQFDTKMEGVKRQLGDTQKDFRKFGAELKSVAGMFAKVGAAAGVFAVAGAAIVKSSLSQIKELKNLSTAAGLTVSQLQRGAFAANTAGISQEKYADILKDVNDKVGDFITTGAGPMIDFFEQIAPKVGITADAFKGLNSQEALGLYVNSLEKANLSQAEMTFYMEAIASDSTMLLPLLKGNGKAMGELSKQAEDLGIGLSEIDVAKAIEANEKLTAMGNIISNEVNQAVIEMSPLLTTATEEMINFVKESGGIRNNVVPAMRSLAVGIGFVMDAFKGIGLVWDNIKLGAMTVKWAVLEIMRGIADSVVNIVNSSIDSISEMMVAASNLVAPFDEELSSGLKNAANAMDSFALSIPAGLRKAAQETVIEVQNMSQQIAEKLAEKPAQIGIAEAFDEIIRKADKAALKAQMLLLNQDESQNKPDATSTTGTDATTDNADPNKSLQVNKLAEYQQETIGILEAMGLRFESQEEMQIAANERELAILQSQRDKKLISEEEYSKQSTDIERRTNEAKRENLKNNLQAGFQLLAQNSSKVGNLMKGVAIVQAIIKGKQSAVDAWQAGMSTGGPFAPVVAAAYTAASIARTGAMINSIKSSGKSAGGGGGGMPSVPAQAQQSSSQGSQQTQAAKIFNVDFTGNSGNSTEQTRNLLSLINEQAGDNVEINLRGG